MEEWVERIKGAGRADLAGEVAQEATVMEAEAEAVDMVAVEEMVVPSTLVQALAAAAAQMEVLGVQVRAPILRREVLVRAEATVHFMVGPGERHIRITPSSLHLDRLV